MAASIPVGAPLRSPLARLKPRCLVNALLKSSGLRVGRGVKESKNGSQERAKRDGESCNVKIWDVEDYISWRKQS